MNRITLAILALAASTASAFAGTVADFEKALQGAYADYRAALFMTNMGKADESSKAVASMSAKWADIEKTWGSSPPPQYADDPKWPETLKSVAEISAKAATEVEAKKLPDAHATLEGIREQISQLHQRNGIQSFSDRMNDYHAAMEEVLAADITKTDDAALVKLHGQAAVLSYLSGQLSAHAPDAAASTPEFQQLNKAVADSVTAFLAAVEAKDAEKLKSAIGALKPAYSKLFLKFG
ncbi:MAG: hypothetical protein WCC66_11510 [Rhizobiaceae bacterium]